MKTRTFAAFFATVVVGFLFFSNNGGLQAQVYLPGTGPEDFKEPTTPPKPIFDGSEFIFEGVILGQSSYKDSALGISTAFEIQILHLFKGNDLELPGTVTLIQMGGRVGMEGTTFSHQIPFAPQRRYIFFANRSPGNFPFKTSSNPLQLTPHYAISFNPELNLPFATGFGVHFQNHAHVYEFLKEYGNCISPETAPAALSIERTREKERQKALEKEEERKNVRKRRIQGKQKKRSSGKKGKSIPE